MRQLVTVSKKTIGFPKFDIYFQLFDEHPDIASFYSACIWEYLGANDSTFFLRAITSDDDFQEGCTVPCSRALHQLHDVPLPIAKIIIEEYCERNDILVETVYPEKPVFVDPKGISNQATVDYPMDRISQFGKSANPSAHTKATTKFLDRIPAHEPIFVLRAQDRLASHFVRQWVAVAAAKGLSAERQKDALACADEMDKWPTRKNPD